MTVTTSEIRKLGIELEKIHRLQEKDFDQERLEGELAVVLAKKMALLPMVREAVNCHLQPLHPEDIERHPMLL